MPREVLGQGVWGTVYDNGDGTVLKLSKRKGGIGDGIEKARREIEVLQALEQRRAHFKILKFPCLIAHGLVDQDTYGMTLSKMDAPFMSEPRFKEMTPAQKARFASSLGEAMAEFNAAFDRDPMELRSRPFPAETGLRDIKSYTPNPADHYAADFLAAEFSEAFSAGAVVFGHGDLNFSNMAVCEDGTLEGFIDFAETGATLPEAEFSHFFAEKEFATQVIAQYEAVTGRPLNPYFFELCAASNALFGAVICEFCIDEPAEAAQARNALSTHLAKLKKIPGRAAPDI